MYKPELPNKYKGKQIILNSGRIIFNSKEDSIMFFSKKCIVFSSVESFDINSDKHFIVNAPKIYLGLDSFNEKEPVLLGNKTNELLKNLIDSLSEFIELIRSGSASPQSIMAGVGLLEGKLKTLQFELKNKELLSTQSFVA